MEPEPEEVIASVIAAEEERCRAVTDGDWPALDKLLHQDLTFVHSNGTVQDKTAYFTNGPPQQRRTTRSGLNVRTFGDIAIMSGYLWMAEGDTEPPPGRFALQVWVREGEAWQLLACQATKTP